jgi:hypothetical protein
MKRLGILIVLAAAGCFFDSQWGEAKRAQQRAAAHATPNAIATAPVDDAQRGPTTTLRMRVHATQEYATQTIDWQKQVRDLVDDANGALAPIGARLDLVAMEAWKASPQTDLDVTLAALRDADAASDVDVVAGMIGSIPRSTAQFHDLGLAIVGGKHLVVRASHREGEYDDIEKLDELSGDERQRLRRERRRHRALSIFLHEIGHTLGAAHEQSADSVMFPSYRPTMAGFGAESAALIRTTLAHRGDSAPAQQVTAAPSSAPLAPDASTVDPLTALAAKDRDTYARADAALRGGHIDDAWTTARPLFAAYPDLYVIQDLRCQLATLRRVDAASVKKECARMIELMKDGGVR